MVSVAIVHDTAAFAANTIVDDQIGPGPVRHILRCDTVQNALKRGAIVVGSDDDPPNPRVSTPVLLRAFRRCKLAEGCHRSVGPNGGATLPSSES